MPSARRISLRWEPGGAAAAMSWGGCWGHVCVPPVWHQGGTYPVCCHVLLRGEAPQDHVSHGEQWEQALETPWGWWGVLPCQQDGTAWLSWGVLAGGSPAGPSYRHVAEMSQDIPISSFLGPVCLTLPFPCMQCNDFPTSIAIEASCCSASFGLSHARVQYWLPLDYMGVLGICFEIASQFQEGLSHVIRILVFVLWLAVKYVCVSEGFLGHFWGFFLRIQVLSQKREDKQKLVLVQFMSDFQNYLQLFGSCDYNWQGLSRLLS